MNLRKSLDIFVPRSGDDPLFVANSWSGLSTACNLQQNHAQAKLAYESAVAAFEKRKEMLTRADRANMRATLAKLHADFENFGAALRESGHALEELPGGAGYLLQKAELY